jgi:hypothetical protein
MIPLRDSETSPWLAATPPTSTTVPGNDQVDECAGLQEGESADGGVCPAPETVDHVRERASRGGRINGAGGETQHQTDHHGRDRESLDCRSHWIRDADGALSGLTTGGRYDWQVSIGHVGPMKAGSRVCRSIE